MFVVSTTERAKRVAKDLKSELESLGIQINWSAALESVARMYGYRNWNALQRSTKDAVPSPDDADASPDEVTARRALHRSVLRGLGVTDADSDRVLDRIRPTDRKQASKAEKAVPLNRELQAFLLKAEEAARAGNWQRAGDWATEGLRSASGASKKPFAAMLEKAAEHNVYSMANFGLAHVYGDIGRKDIGKGAQILRSVIDDEREPPIPDDLVLTAILVLGDIASGLHGPHDDEVDENVGLDLYVVAADEFGSPVGAYNAALRFQREDPASPEAEHYYRMAADGGHAQAMTNLACMIMDGGVKGTGQEVADLFRRAAALGDRNAAEAVSRLHEIVPAVDRAQAFADEAMAASAGRFDEIIRTGLGADPDIWLDILKEHGWRIENPDFRAKGEGAYFGTAVSSEGLRVPMFISAAGYTFGDVGDKLVRKLEDIHEGKETAILLFSRTSAISMERDLSKAALCLGRLKVDGRWSDFFLAGGGLDEAIRQRRVMDENPDFNPVAEFASPKAFDAMDRVGQKVFGRLNDIFGDDPRSPFRKRA